MTYNPNYRKYYEDITILTSIYNDNVNVLLALFTGDGTNNGYGITGGGYYISNSGSLPPAGTDITTYVITAATSSSGYIPSKLPVNNTYNGYSTTNGFNVSSNNFGSDNVRWGHRLAKYLFRYNNETPTTIMAMAVSSIDYLYQVYIHNSNKISTEFSVFQLTSCSSNNTAVVIPMLAAIDSIYYNSETLTHYTSASDPRTYYLPWTGNSQFSLNATTYYATPAGYISYIDLYRLRSLATASDPTYNQAYPFFDVNQGTQEISLGIVTFLLTNEGQEKYPAVQKYLQTTSVDFTTSSKFNGIEVYKNVSPDTTTYSLAEDIINTYWIIGYIGQGFGSYDPYNGKVAYLSQYLIEGVNYSGSGTTWTGGPLTLTNGLLVEYPLKLFNIWSCCDTGWGYDDGSTAYNNCTITMEMFSYQLLTAALTQDYDKFCYFHRNLYYMLYVQNGTADGTGPMAEANSQTYDNPPIGGYSTYVNRLKPNTDLYGSSKYPWLYSSFCPGYQPYANFFGKVDVSNKDGTDLSGPIYIMSNPYYKGSFNKDISSASDADFNICLAYKVAMNNTWLSNYDTLADATGPVSDEIKYKVGAYPDITWEYMHTQIKNTILSETGSDIPYDGTLPRGSNFSPGSVVPTGYSENGPFLTTNGHDANNYTTDFHPDYIDLALFQDFINEFGAACFLEGTKILTSRGYVPVEALTKEDQLVSYGDILENKFHERDLRVVPIRWVGKYSKSKPSPKHQPICITKDALSVGMPFQDVYVSGNHGVVLRKKRVPAKRLMGDKIYRVPSERVVYYHVEVEGHQVISANGLLTETYLDVGKRKAFTTVF
jgi:hypothetical protein